MQSASIQTDLSLSSPSCSFTLRAKCEKDASSSGRSGAKKKKSSLTGSSPSCFSFTLKQQLAVIHSGARYSKLKAVNLLKYVVTVASGQVISHVPGPARMNTPVSAGTAPGGASCLSGLPLSPKGSSVRTVRHKSPIKSAESRRQRSTSPACSAV